MADQSCTMKNTIKVTTSNGSSVGCSQQNGHHSPTGGASDKETSNGGCLLAPVPAVGVVAPFNASPVYSEGMLAGSDQRSVSPSSRGSSPQSAANAPHVVHVHVQPGETFTVRMGEQMQRIPGPATVRMVSNNGPPLPMPMQVPPGHMVQQIVDEHGILTHVILSPQPGVPSPLMTGPGSTQPSQYFSGYGPQYGPAHPSQYAGHQGAPPMHAVPPPHLHSSPPPSQGPPSHHIRADERTMKQKMKLQKKLASRTHEPSYNFMPHDGYVNYVPHRSNAKMNGIDIQHGCPPESVHSSSSSNDGQDIEDERQSVIDMLSSMSQPDITDIGARSALVHIQPPPCNITSMSNLSYRLQLAGQDGKYSTVYGGDATEITLKDLKPSTEYQLKTCAVLDDLNGDMTEAAKFKTLCCEPDPPLPPKCYQRSKTYIFLKWTATSDNGAKVTSYSLEFDQGRRDGTFVEVYNDVSRQFKVQKLQASTGYTFRLAAINREGKSAFSDPVMFCTSGSVPMQPDPPMLSDKYVNAMTISWIKRPNDDEFKLQMEDEESGHGFVTQYNGPDLSHKVEKLVRNKEYKFRLSANNDEGSSKWSDIVRFRTLPATPGPPGKPQTKGKIHSTHFRVTWDQPKDDGGSPVENYILELDRGKGFEKVYEGRERDCNCDHLEPGQTYRVRVHCCSLGGASPCSDIASVTTTAVGPGQCQPPKLLGKPRATSLVLKWSHPEYNGGAAVTDFEVQMVGPDNESRLVYKGHVPDCTVAGLAPGRPYLFQVRAHNRAGVSAWSEPLEIVSGPGVPDAPDAPWCHCKSPQSVVVSWDEPSANGAIITEYRLESQRLDEFIQVHTGPGRSHEVKGLVPATTYGFRVLAVNSAGVSPASPVTECTMPASSPGAVTSVRATSTATTVTVSWKAPPDNGSEIVAYNIDLGEKQLVSPDAAMLDGVLEHTIDELVPETTYKVRVQAVNSIGVGSFSQPARVTTLALPPLPPRLECATVGANSLKLKWGDGKNPDLLQYILEMMRDNGSWYPVYSGSSQGHKVNKLNELCQYTFRICASNDAGQGPYSSLFTFQTCKALPPAVKDPRVSELCTSSCQVSWNPLKPMGQDVINYMLQLQTRDQEYKVIYKGPDTSYRLKDLEPKTDYVVRVCAIRCGRAETSTTADLSGAFSPGIRFTTQIPAVERRRSASVVEQKLIEPKQWTDQQITMFVVSVFIVLAILLAMIVQRIYQHARH